MKIVLTLLVTAGTALWPAGGFSAQLDATRITSPQVVAGPVGDIDYRTRIVLQSTHDADCTLSVNYHEGAGQSASVVPLTNGSIPVNPFGLVVPRMGRQALDIAGPGSGQTFIGATTFDVQSLDCVDSLEIQTAYLLEDSSGNLLEFFSYPETRQISVDSCVRVPARLDLDTGDADAEIPAFAAVAVDPLTGVNRCFDLWDENGSQISSTQCAPFDGSHGAQLLTEIFPTQGEFEGSWRMCFPGSGSATGVVDAVFLDIVTDGGATQFTTASTSDQNTTGTTCVPGPNTLCMNEGRFEVQVDWFNFDPTPIPATVSKTAEDSGLFYFFDPNDVELLVKVVNACPADSRFWVFAAGLTNVEFELRVTDTEAGQTRTYFNPPGPAAPIMDTNAFATCP